MVGNQKRKEPRDWLWDGSQGRSGVTCSTLSEPYGSQPSPWPHTWAIETPLVLWCTRNSQYYRDGFAPGPALGSPVGIAAPAEWEAERDRCMEAIAR